jgi:hypothetical protein
LLMKSAPRSTKSSAFVRPARWISKKPRARHHFAEGGRQTFSSYLRWMFAPFSNVSLMNSLQLIKSTTK